MIVALMVSVEKSVRDGVALGTMRTALDMAPVILPQVCVAVTPAGQEEAVIWPTAHSTAVTMETAQWTLPQTLPSVPVTRDSLTMLVRAAVLRVVLLMGHVCAILVILAMNVTVCALERVESV